MARDRPGIGPEDLVFLPLGGTDEVGMNLALYHYGGKWIMVDCGMTFAGEGLPGIDLVFPDPSFIEERREDLLGIVLTHGHEDHIGAIPHLWPRLKAPLFATRFTAELIKDKLSEFDLLGKAAVREMAPGADLDLGPFEIRYVPMAHSIPEAHSLRIKTPAGTVFHTGDWKLDDQPQVGRFSPPEDLAALGAAGVTALIGDSTNIFNDYPSGSEQTVKEHLSEIVAKAAHRVVVTTFASNVARVKSVAEVARRSGRHVALAGRSMDRIWRIGRDTGYLADLPDPLPIEEIDTLPRSKQLILCTGCQGEPRAAIARFATGEHRWVQLTAGDMVLFSSKIIPGNETSVGTLVNILAGKDIEVVTEKDAFIHVSGHPGQPELRQLYGWLKPEKVVAVHGERRHVKRHAAFAKELGVPDSLAAQNGKAIRLAPGPLSVVDEIDMDCLILDGTQLVSVGDVGVGERRKLASEGHLCVILLIDEDDKMLGPPELIVRGLPDYEDGGRLAGAVEQAVEQAYEELRARDRRDDKAVSEAARIAARRQCRRLLGKNAVVDVRILRLEDEA